MTQKELHKALNQAYRLGQIYWQQADSEYASQWKKSGQTHAQFEALVKDSCAQLAEQPAEKETAMPITDANGQALRPQYRVVEQRGKWTLLYDQHVLGNTVQHQFRIQKLQHDIVLYPGITLAEAQKRFAEKLETDNE
jgi:hypothetical protein